MAWAKPQYSKGQIDRAGEILSLEQPLVDGAVEIDQYFDAIETVSNWRAVHSYPLQAMKMALKRRAKRVCHNAIVAQRLKRLASIRLKLRLSQEVGHHPSLSQMQDIGGCRAVLDTVDQVRQVENMFSEAARKNPRRGSQYSKTYDYISSPKVSGYRSVHLVYRFKSDSAEHSCYNGQRIEIQLRSRQQHYWATAVETYSTFSGEALKSNIGPIEWKRFFAVASSLFALNEQQPTVPGTPSSMIEILPELRSLCSSLRVFNVLRGWSAVAKFTEDNPSGASAAALYLLVLDTEKFATTLHAYTSEQTSLATSEYARIEKEHPNLQAVLVSVDSVAGLRAAYPNYFLDTSSFLELIERSISEEPPTASN